MSPKRTVQILIEEVDDGAIIQMSVSGPGLVDSGQFVNDAKGATEVAANLHYLANGFAEGWTTGKLEQVCKDERSRIVSHLREKADECADQAATQETQPEPCSPARALIEIAHTTREWAEQIEQGVHMRKDRSET